MMQHPVGGVIVREGRTRGGRQASFTLSTAVLWDGQGTEFNRSFRKLSGSVISDNKPRKQRQRLLRSRNATPQPTESRLPHPREHTVLRQVLTQPLTGTPVMTGEPVTEQTLLLRSQALLLV